MQHYFCNRYHEHSIELKINNERRWNQIQKKTLISQLLSLASLLCYSYKYTRQHLRHTFFPALLFLSYTLCSGHLDVTLPDIHVFRHKLSDAVLTSFTKTLPGTHVSTLKATFGEFFCSRSLRRTFFFVAVVISTVQAPKFIRILFSQKPC